MMLYISNKPLLLNLAKLSDQNSLFQFLHFLPSLSTSIKHLSPYLLVFSFWTTGKKILNCKSKAPTNFIDWSLRQQLIFFQSSMYLECFLPVPLPVKHFLSLVCTSCSSSVMRLLIIEISMLEICREPVKDGPADFGALNILEKLEMRLVCWVMFQSLTSSLYAKAYASIESFYFIWFLT